MIRRFRITGYKTFDELEIELKPLAVLFGPNASGKSNFLDAIQLLSNIVTKKTLKEAFDPPYRGRIFESFNFEYDGLKGIRNKEQVSFTLEVDVKLSNAVINNVNKSIQDIRSTEKMGENRDDDDNNIKTHKKVIEKNLRYRITIEARPTKGIIRVSDEYLCALTKDGEPTKSRKPFIEKNEKGNKIHVRMEGQAHPRYYEQYLDRSILSETHYAPHHPHIVAMQNEMELWHLFYFEPRERMRRETPIRISNNIGQMGEELASFLFSLKNQEPKSFESLVKNLNILLPSISDINVDINNDGMVELNVIENDIEISSRLLSEGTLRILGLLSLQASSQKPSLIAFEEPENGVHPRRIKIIAEILKGFQYLEDTQVIITSHSPVFLDEMPFESLYVCKRENNKTNIVEYSKWPRLWGALTSKMEIDRILDQEDETPISIKILRGDFDE